MSTLMLLLVAPLLWSAAISGMRRVAVRGQILADGAEKTLLGLILLPVMAGLLVQAVPMPAPVLAALPTLPSLTVHDSFTAILPATTRQFDPWAMIPVLVLWVWLAGAVVALLRLVDAALVFGRAAHTAQPLGDSVHETMQPVPAFVWGGKVVVPAPLRAHLTAEQFRLIVAHEQAHLRRWDPLWFLAFAVIDAILWFNPFVAAQTRACRLAAEVACDRAAAAGDSRTYARALLTALKLPHVAETLVPTLSGKDGYRLRLDRIMTGRKAPKAAAWLCAAAALSLPLIAGQFAFAKGVPAPLAAVAPAADPAPAASAAAFAVPVVGQFSDGFGMRKDPLTGEDRLHQGVDFVAPLDTPVTAAAQGTVSFSGDRWGYGTTVEIDHSNGMKTRYAHLTRADVSAGDDVAAGQAIGTVGISGKTNNQPHLHFEIWTGDHTIDPAPLLGLP